MLDHNKFWGESLRTWPADKAIVIVQPHLRFGGAERQTVLVANSLVALGQPCTVILHHREGGLLSDLDSRVNLITLGAPGHSRVLIAALRLRKVLRALPPSYVIVKLWSSIMAVALVDRLDPRHTYNYCEDLDPLDHANYIKFGSLKQGIVRRIFRSRRHLTANTHKVAESMITMYGLRSIPDVVSSAVDIELTQERADLPDATRAQVRDGAVNIVTVGSLIERKGLRILWQALQQLKIPVRWHIVGEGPLAPWLRELETEWVDVRLYGGLSNPYRVMRDCDLLVHGASSEAFGIVLLEALAVNTPVVAANAIGPSEMVSVLGVNRSCLQIFDSANADDLARILIARGEHLAMPLAAGQGPTYIDQYSLRYSVWKWLERAENA